MSNFHKASNFTIENLNQTDVRVDLEQQKHKAFERLLSEIVQGASHDSGERFDAPTCHPDTRTAVLDDINSWVDNDDGPTRIMWLNGPAGAGKSAIAQTTADDYHSEGKLIASFFFSRFAAGRNTKTGLIATIAYQLSVSIPETKEYIINNIGKNPNIFKANIKTQFQSLVVEPYKLLEQTGSVLSRPILIIIDGLDECNNADHQAEIINAVGTLVANDHASRLRILIASRPEPRIHRTFDDEVISMICTRLTLDDKYNPDKDIELFLRSSFQVLKRHHILTPMLQSWPSENIIETLVQKSSGQFIYAATVVKYVSDLQQNPMKRLDIVLNIKDAGTEQPLAQLDALYTVILSNIHREYRKVASIFEAIMFLETFEHKYEEILSFHWVQLLTASFLNDFLYFENEILLVLADLSSIVNATNPMEKGVYRGIRFYHASFTDYLQDPSRSQKYHIDEHQSHSRLAMYCINHIAGPPERSDVVTRYSIWRLYDHYKHSNWDDNVLRSILSNGLLAVGGVKSYHKKSYVYLDHEKDELGLGEEYPLKHTFLGLLICKCSKEEIKDDLKNAIDSAFLGHLQQYAPHDILTAYYTNSWLNLTRERSLFLVMPALEDAPKENIAFDITHEPVKVWLKLLVRRTGYSVHLSQDTHIKSTCRILDILMAIAISDGTRIEGLSDLRPYYSSDFFSGSDKPLNGLPAPFIQLAKDLFDNLPDTNEITTAISQKWGSIQPISDKLHKASDDVKLRVRVLDEIVRSYLTRSLKQHVSSESLQMEADEQSSTAVDDVQRSSQQNIDSKKVQIESNEHQSTSGENLTKYQIIPTTRNSMYTTRFLILIVSVQFLLIAYMFIRLNGTSASASDK